MGGSNVYTAGSVGRGWGAPDAGRCLNVHLLKVQRGAQLIVGDGPALGICLVDQIEQLMIAP